MLAAPQDRRQGRTKKGSRGPLRVRPKELLMNCPRCKDDLRRTDRTGVEIDFCPRCRGVWLDGGELEKLLDRSQGYVPDPGYAPEYRGGDSGYRSEPHREEPRREGYREEPRREGYRDHHRGGDGRHDGHGHKKKKGFLGEIFDIFD